MKVRTPKFELTGAMARWGENAEAVAVINAGAIIPSALERYLIRVLGRARKELDPIRDADLIRDIDWFNKQEGQHARMHTAYLEMLRDGGYPRIFAFEDAYAADLQRFFDTESLAWNLAYAEGFESTGAAMADAWLDGTIADLCGDRGSVPMQLWRWHLAEEFEHRSVVHDVLDRLYGKEEAFALRKQGADIGRPHFSGHSAQAGIYIHAVNRAGMSPAEHEASLEREQQAYLGLAGSAAALMWVYEPDYDPATITPPRAYESVLARYA